MGKRELLLIAGFVVVGAIVYQVTAPASQPGRARFSISGLIENIRREVAGNRANAEVVTTTSYAVDPLLAELTIRVPGTITVLGEDRSDVSVELKVRSTGYDEAEAQSLAKQSVLNMENIGGGLVVSITFPNPGSQRAALTLKIPSRLRVRVDPNAGRLELTNIAAADVLTARGDTIVRHVPGRVTLTHRGGDLLVEDVGSLRLSARGSDAKVARIHGEAALQLQSGNLRASGVGGPLEIESTETDITLEKLADLKGILRVNAVGGQLTIRNLQSEARIDGRGVEIDVRLERPALLSVYNTGDTIEITPPSGGYQLDAVATNGRITLPKGLESRISLVGAEGDREQRASGKIEGGGPPITIRATRGDIRVNARENTGVQR